MWVCQCGYSNPQVKPWCGGCSAHFSQVSWWNSSQSSRASLGWQRARSASRHRKGSKGSKGSKGKGAGKTDKELRGTYQKEEKEQQVARAFQPFTAAPKELDTPWQNSTPTSRLPRQSYFKEREEEKEEEGKETKEEANAEEEEAKEHAKALMSKNDLPKELKQALMKFTSKSAPEMTHADINKLKRLKAVIQRGKESLEKLEGRWMEFQRLSKLNWEQQKKEFLASREEELKQLKANQERLANLQREMASKATIEESSEEEDLKENSAFEEEMGVAPWDVELPEEDPDLMSDAPDKEANAMQPFARPKKISRVGEKKPK